MNQNPPTGGWKLIFPAFFWKTIGIYDMCFKHAGAIRLQVFCVRSLLRLATCKGSGKTTPIGGPGCRNIRSLAGVPSVWGASWTPLILFCWAILGALIGVV